MILSASAFIRKKSSLVIGISNDFAVSSIWEIFLAPHSTLIFGDNIEFHLIQRFASVH